MDAIASGLMTRLGMGGFRLDGRAARRGRFGGRFGTAGMLGSSGKGTPVHAGECLGEKYGQSADEDHCKSAHLFNSRRFNNKWLPKYSLTVVVVVLSTPVCYFSQGVPWGP